MKETHFDLLERTRGEYLETARACARKLLKKQTYVTVNDIRKACPPPEDVDPRVMGAIFAPSEFESLGAVRSDRTECHGRDIKRFRLKEPVRLIEEKPLPRRIGFLRRFHAEDTH